MTLDITKYNFSKLDPTKAENAELATLALSALTMIAKIVGGSTGATATQVLVVVKAILASLQGAYKGEVTPDSVRAEMLKLRKSLADNDARALKALQAKFPKQ